MHKIICAFCGDTFESMKWKKKYCSRNCYAKARRGQPRLEETRKKISDSNKGKPKSEETKKKLSEARIGKKFGPRDPSVGKKISEALTGRIFSDEHKRNLSKSLDRGKNSVPLGRFGDPRYYPWQRSVFLRDDYTCRDCGKHEPSGDGLHAHHVLSYFEYKDRRFDVDNGLTLCKTCHRAVHGYRVLPTEQAECRCGCGEMLTLKATQRGSVFKVGHNTRLLVKDTEYKREMSEKITGKKRSDETRARMSLAQQKRFRNKNSSGKEDDENAA